MVPEQAGHVDAGVGTEHLDVEPETVGVSAAQFLYSHNTAASRRSGDSRAATYSLYSASRPPLTTGPHT